MLKKYISMALFPIFFYFFIFCILTSPLILKFSTHFFADKGDGLYQAWNIWWVNKAVTELHQSPWWTFYLHYPHGVSLVGHTLNPFNGFMGIILLKFLTLIQAHNFIVIFSFAAGGLTAFWLAYYFTRSYWASLIAGFIFTFSNYHFAHAEGHLNLVSLEWIPLFMLCWYILITRPGILMAIASGIALFLVFLCDYYYFLYCVLAGCLIIIWHAAKSRDFFFIFKKKHLIPLIVFIAILLVTAGPLIISLLCLNAGDPFWGSHPSNENCLDLLAPFIYGGHWRFADLTKFYWSKLPGNIHETSVHIGMAVLFLFIYVWSRRHRLKIQGLQLWYFTAIFFFIMSLGPVLHIWGKEISFIWLPYALFEKIFPPLRLSGCPVRMMIMVMLSVSIICAIGFKILFQKPAGRILAALLLIMLFFEYLPKPMPASGINTPEYVKILKELPAGYGIIDTVTGLSLAAYYQTIHEKPMAFSDVSRIPKSVLEKDNCLRRLVQDREYTKLYYGYNLRYLVTDTSAEIQGIKMLYNGDGVKVYDLF